MNALTHCEPCNQLKRFVRPVILEGDDEPTNVCNVCYPNVEIDRKADQEYFGYGPEGGSA